MKRKVFKSKMYAISSDTHQLQLIKLYDFKLERFKSIQVEKAITLDQRPEKRKKSQAVGVGGSPPPDEIMSVPKIERVTDYLSTGSVLGEMSLLTCKPSNVKVTCETSAQVGALHTPQGSASLRLEVSPLL